MKTVRYCWCTYREWSFQVLEGLLDHPNAKCEAILTTSDCIYDFSKFEAAGIKIFRMPPKDSLKESSEFLSFTQSREIEILFFYGWSWMIPSHVFKKCLSVTLHPGKLPNDKGGSPLQNQIRNGETWSYANIIEIAEKLDGGDVFMQKKFSLVGDISDVWARMVSTGVHVTRTFLSQIATGDMTRKVQIGEGTIYKRVTPAQAQLNPATQSVLEMHNVIRAHNETDPNTYVKRAFLNIGGMKIIISRSSLESSGMFIYRAEDIKPAELYEISEKTNNNEACLSLKDKDGLDLYLTQFRVTALV